MTWGLGLLQEDQGKTKDTDGKDRSPAEQRRPCAAAGTRRPTVLASLLLESPKLLSWKAVQEVLFT